MNAFTFGFHGNYKCFATALLNLIGLNATNFFLNGTVERKGKIGFVIDRNPCDWTDSNGNVYKFFRIGLKQCNCGCCEIFVV